MCLQLTGDIWHVDNAQEVCLSLCPCNCRKRKSPEAHVRPRIVHMVWDVDAESTSAIMKDVGVSLLRSDKQATDTTASSRSISSSVRPRVTSRVSVVDCAASVHVVLFDGIIC